MTAEQLFERTILNSLMNNKPYFSKVYGILKPEFFTFERREIFNLFNLHYQEFKEPAGIADVGIKIKNLQNQDTKEKIVNELKEIHKVEIPTSLESLSNETLKFVKDALYLKALEVGSEGLMTKSDKLKLQAEKILDERAKVNLDSDLGMEFSDEEILEYYNQELSGILTHLRSFNERLGPGFLKKTLSLIAAPSGVGKSLLMTDLISGWIKQGLNVLLVSLEMSSEEVLKRVHSNVLNIPISDLKPGMDVDEFKRKMESFRANGGGVFYAKDFPALSMGSLRLESLLEAFKNEKDLEFDAVLVDYLGIMKSDLISPSAGLYSYVKSIAEELRAVAVRKNISLISASQLNRCFWIDSDIMTPTGLIKAKDLQIGDKVISIDGENEIKEISIIEKKKSFKIKTKSGKEILVSKDHKIPTQRGVMTIEIGLREGDKIHVIE